MFFGVTRCSQGSSTLHVFHNHPQRHPQRYTYPASSQPFTSRSYCSATSSSWQRRQSCTWDGRKGSTSKEVSKRQVRRMLMLKICYLRLNILHFSDPEIQPTSHLLTAL